VLPFGRGDGIRRETGQGYSGGEIVSNGSRARALHTGPVKLFRWYRLVSI